MDSTSHFKRIRLVLLVILALNWLVASAKIIFGLISKSSSMTADGFHSFSDGASNIVGLIGIYFACQPSDKDHPYGHKKYETFFSLVIATILILVCFELIEEGIKRLSNPVLPDITIFSFAVMLSTMIINFIVMNYERKKGKEFQSDILTADSLHTRADIFTSMSVIISLAAVKLGYPVLDPVATLLIASFIAKAAFDIIKGGSKILCDTVAVDEKKIVDIVLSIPGVKTCHKIRTRGRPDDIHVDLHVQVDSEMHIKEAHKISYAIEEAIKKGIPQVTDVVTHMEPIA